MFPMEISAGGFHSVSNPLNSEYFTHGGSNKVSEDCNQMHFEHVCDLDLLISIWNQPEAGHRLGPSCSAKEKANASTYLPH